MTQAEESDLFRLVVRRMERTMEMKLEYPKYLYRPNGESRLVEDVTEHEALGAEWAESPAVATAEPDTSAPQITEAEAAKLAEEQAARDAEIARMLSDFPAYESVIEEARISGSPLHLVAAGIAAAEDDRKAREAAEQAKADKAAAKVAKAAEKAAAETSATDDAQLPLAGDGQ